MAYSGIHIKAPKVGSLHKLLGVSQGSKIPSSQLSVKAGDSTAMKKKKQFAINAKKWNHGGGSISKLMGG